MCHILYLYVVGSYPDCGDTIGNTYFQSVRKIPYEIMFKILCHLSLKVILPNINLHHSEKCGEWSESSRFSLSEGKLFGVRRW